MTEREEEISQIRQRYDKRFATNADNDDPVFRANYTNERMAVYRKILSGHFKEPVSQLTLLEIGAGNGSNLALFEKEGFALKNLYGNELLDVSAALLKEVLPEGHVFPGDALAIPEDQKYDIVFQSTVFTSILDNSFRHELAAKMKRLLKPGGMILWYDFTFNNPSNKDVRKVTRKEITQLFPGADYEFHKVTLAPPIGRRIGRFYPLVNALAPFLRTHLVAAITFR